VKAYGRWLLEISHFLVFLCALSFVVMVIYQRDVGMVVERGQITDEAYVRLSEPKQRIDGFFRDTAGHMSMLIAMSPRREMMKEFAQTALSRSYYDLACVKEGDEIYVLASELDFPLEQCRNGKWFLGSKLLEGDILVSVFGGGDDKYLEFISSNSSSAVMLRMPIGAIVSDVKNLSRLQEEVFLVDEEGNYISGPLDGREINASQFFKKTFPEAASILDSGIGSLVGGGDLFFASRQVGFLGDFGMRYVRANSGANWYLISVVHAKEAGVLSGVEYGLFHRVAIMVSLIFLVASSFWLWKIGISK
jgi:hypothetical protein